LLFFVAVTLVVDLVDDLDDYLIDFDSDQHFKSPSIPKMSNFLGFFASFISSLTHSNINRSAKKIIQKIGKNIERVRSVEEDEDDEMRIKLF